MRVTGVPSTLTHTAPAPVAMSPHGVGTLAGTDAANSLLSGSIRETDPVRWCNTHTPPAPTVRNLGRGVTGTLATTALFLGSTRITSAPSVLETQSAVESPTTTYEPGPTNIRFSIAPVCSLARMSVDDAAVLSVTNSRRLPATATNEPSSSTLKSTVSVRETAFFAGSICATTWCSQSATHSAVSVTAIPRQAFPLRGIDAATWLVAGSIRTSDGGR